MTLTIFALFAAFGGGLTIVAPLLVYAFYQRRLWHERLRDVGAELGLTFDAGSLLTPATLTGEVDGVAVVVDTYTQNDGDSSSTTMTRVRATVAPLLGVRLESNWALFRGLLTAAGVDTGDPGFDRTFHVTGVPEVVSGVLTAENREVVGALVRAGGFVEPEGVRWEEKHGATPAADLVPRIREVVAVARRVAAPVDLTALTAVGVADPEPTVRTVAMARLLEALARTPDRRVLDGLAAGVTDPATRARVADLRDDVDTLRSLLSGARTGAREAAIALARRALPGDEGDLERALIRLVESPDLGVIRALGAVGTVAAVRFLRVHAERTFVVDGSATAARDAIHAIQARIPGGERGALAVTEAAGGDLSVAPDSGRLASDDRTDTS